MRQAPIIASFLLCSLATAPLQAGAAQISAGVDSSSRDVTLRRIEQGQLTGKVVANGSLAWRGIPYARPPVGELRWRAPQNPRQWEGVLAATRDSAACLQTMHLAAPHKDNDGDGYVGSEDCLYLNVFAPAQSAGKKLPVMYWIYGGGNVGGSNASPLYDGAALAEQRQVVVVTINYRLGPLGWFLHPALIGNDTSDLDRSGNWATLDTIRGLEWVHDNISVFGGDPANVTIFGESAGGVNVMSLVISPLARGLFHRAIVQSGGVRSTPLTSVTNYVDEAVAGHPASAPEIVNKLLVYDGKAKDRAQAKLIQESLNAAAIVKMLYDMPALELMKIYNPTGIRRFSYPSLYADGVVLPKQPPLQAIAAGNFNKVPVILGTNRDERRIYLYRDPRWSKVLASDPDAYIRYARYSSLAWQLRGVDDIARAMQGAGHAPVFAYRFDWDEQAEVGGVNMAVALGAAHTVEIPFVFGQDLGLTSSVSSTDETARRVLSSKMMSYWTQFAYTGNPGKGRDGQDVQWSSWGKDKRVLFDTPRDGGIRMSDDELTLEGLKADLLSDRNFKDQAIHCEIYAATIGGTPAWDEAEYLTLGREGCARNPVRLEGE